MATLLESLSVDQAVASSLCGFDPGGGVAGPAAAVSLNWNGCVSEECSQGTCCRWVELEDLVAHAHHDHADVDSRNFDVFEQGGGVGRVSPLAVAGDIVGLGGEADERADAASLDLGQASTEIRGSCGHSPTQRPGQRIVAASIQEHQVGLGLCLHVAQYEGQWDSLEIDRRFSGKPRIDRHQEVLLDDLERMPGVEKERHVDSHQLGREFLDDALHLSLAEIEADDHLESEASQSRSYIRSVVARVREGAGVLIGRIADNEGNSTLCRGRCGLKDENSDQDAETRKPIQGAHDFKCLGAIRSTETPFCHQHDYTSARASVLPEQACLEMGASVSQPIPPLVQLSHGGATAISVICGKCLARPRIP